MIGGLIKFIRFVTNPNFFVAPGGMDRPKKARQYFLSFKASSLEFNKDYHATMFWSLIFGNSLGRGGIENLGYSGAVFEESLRVIHEAISDDRFLAKLNERHSPRSDQFFHELLSKYLSMGKELGSEER